MSDFFKEREHLDKLGQALKNYQQTGQGLEPDDPDWHVPWLLNEAVSHLTHHLDACSEGTEFARRTPAERKSLESERFYYFASAFEHLTEKYRVASRACEVLRQIADGKTGFILFLRGFGSRAVYFTDFSTTHGTGSGKEVVQIDKMAKDLDPVPLVWVSNPVDSGPLNSVATGRKSDSGYRVDLGDTWESGVRGLIATASFIVVQNDRMTPGIVREIQLVREMGRQAHTFFHSTAMANEILGSCNAQQLTRDVVKRVKSLVSPRNVGEGALPPPTVLWVKGARRKVICSRIEAVFGMLMESGLTNTRLPLDFLLDSTSHLVGCSVLMEDLDLIAFGLLSCAGNIRQVDERDFPGGSVLARRYDAYGLALRTAIEMTPPVQDAIARRINTLEQFWKCLGDGGVSLK